MRISDWSSDVCSSDLFPISLPCLHSSLNNASVVNALKIFKPDEPMTLIFLRETGNRPGAMLFHTPRQIVGDADIEIGRASGRERVCQYVKISVVAVSLKKKKYVLDYKISIEKS